MVSPSSKKSTHFLAGKRIVVAGAGVAGLGFAVSLHKLWPSICSSSSPPAITIYERDPSADPPNREGYSLSLRSDKNGPGIQTLQKMGMLDKMMEASLIKMTDTSDDDGEGKRMGGGGVCIWNRNFEVVMKIKGKTPAGCPVSGLRIARKDLRATLAGVVEELPNVEIKWDNAITDVSSTKDGRVEINTSKGEINTTDLLLAADGSSSKLRGILRPNDSLVYTGVTVIAGHTSIENHHPRGRYDEYGPVISGAGRSLVIAAVDKQKMMWALSWYVDAPQLAKRQPMPLEHSKALIEEAKNQGGDAYGERFLRILRDTDLESVVQFNAMDKQAFPHSEEFIQASGLEALNGKVVFLGDANHAVSPFAGNGANLALMDSWDFAESLVNNPSMAEAIVKYDKLAVGRAKRVVGISHFVIRMFHSSGWMLWLYMGIMSLIRWLFFIRVD